MFRYRILKKIWQPFLSVFLIFFVTLLVFPSIISDVQYCKIGNWPIVIHISLFSFSDTIARVRRMRDKERESIIHSFTCRFSVSYRIDLNQSHY